MRPLEEIRKNAEQAQSLIATVETPELLRQYAESLQVALAEVPEQSRTEVIIALSDSLDELTLAKLEPYLDNVLDYVHDDAAEESGAGIEELGIENFEIQEPSTVERVPDHDDSDATVQTLPFTEDDFRGLGLQESDQFTTPETDPANDAGILEGE